MKTSKTNRGFSISNFTDRNGVQYSIQKSSIATEDCIWLGASEIGITIGYPWEKVSEKQILDKFNGNAIVGNNRMHLNRKQVKALLPLLQKFVKTGEL